ncbi:uncharacterized protein LOC135219663 [Macrobrachium nipponense]|uniref:uncharacterized protein LOC135219663 n=1 Tax=Macrobrachium nipponense TaxID=159736 RepID=UPI0030C7E9F8
MFGSYDTQERRRSMSYLSTNDKSRPRSASTGVLELSPVSNFYSQRSPATPCFVSPRMAFSTQFNYDSPIQVLTSSSPGVFRPMSVPRLPGRYSLKRLPLKCKALLTVILLSLATCLYIFRTSIVDESIDCNLSGTCDDHSHEHSSLERFVRAVTGPGPNHHTLTGDLDNPEIGSHEAHEIYQGSEWADTITDLTDGASSKQSPGNGNRVAVIVGSHVDLPEESIGHNTDEYATGEPYRNIGHEWSNVDGDGQADQSYSLGSAPLAQLPPNTPAGTMKEIEDYLSQGMHGELKRDGTVFIQEPQMGHGNQHFGSHWGEAAHSHYQGDMSNRVGQMGQMQFGYRDNDHRQPRHIENLRMDRLPPGVNPNRYFDL